MMYEVPQFTLIGSASSVVLGPFTPSGDLIGDVAAALEAEW